MRVQHLGVSPSQAADIARALDAQLGEELEGVEGPVIAPRVLPAAEYDAVPWSALRIWCHERGVYGIPTTEVVDWLRRFIRGRSAIEIGAAHGVFGTALGIPPTDSFVQLEPVAREFYRAASQPIVGYARRVERLDAVSAVKRYRPKVVFGSWVTQYGLEGEGCMFGVREDQILSRSHVQAYVVFGARSTHARKNIAKQAPKGWRYRMETHPGFRCRVSDASTAAMFIWERST